MRSQFKRDLADPDQAVWDTAAERPGQPIRMRVQPTLLRGTDSRHQYLPWRDMRWVLTCDTPEETFAVRDAMAVFFERLSEAGPARVIAQLQSMPDNEEVA